MANAIIQFFNTGAFPNLKLGQSIEECQQLFGPPEDITPPNDYDSVIIKYESLQLMFVDGELTMIKLDSYGGPLKLPAVLGVAETDLPVNITLYEFLEKLDSWDVFYQIEEKRTYDWTLSIRTKGGVVIFFDLEDRKFPVIVKELSTG